MTDFTELAAATGSGAAVIAELAEQTAAREPLNLISDRLIGFVLAPGQRLETVDTERYQSRPERKTGGVTLADADSFVTYVGRHATDDGTTIWSDIDKATITAIIDDHEAGGLPGWAQHRAVLHLRKTKDWCHWTAADGKWMRQQDFAEHIEDGVDAVENPDPATMLEVAQTFHAKTGVSFTSTKALGGDIELNYEETATAKAGQKGRLEVPQRFTLVLAPFDGSDVNYRVEARFRYRLNDGNLTLGYRLIRPDRTLKVAFDDIVQKVAAAGGLPVMSGTPRP